MLANDSYLVSALHDVGFVLSVNASFDVLRLSSEAGLDQAGDFSQVCPQGQEVVRVAVERDLSVVDATLRQCIRHLVGKETVRVACKRDYLHLLTLFVVDQSVWGSGLVR